MLSNPVIKLVGIIFVTPYRSYIGDVIKFCDNVC